MRHYNTEKLLNTKDEVLEGETLVEFSPVDRYNDNYKTPDIPFPVEAGKLRNVKQLEIRRCSFLPDIFDQFPNLKHLHIFDCSITSLPPSMSRLNLMTFDIVLCPSLTDVPDEIWNMTVVGLVIDGVPWQELPKNIFNMTELLELSLRSLRIQQIPEEIGNMTSLEKISINDCNNITSLPETFGNLHRLNSLIIISCRRMNIPETIGQLKYLNWLELTDLNLREFPTFIYELSNLHTLYLRANKLTKRPDFSPLSNLMWVVLCDNDIPDEELGEIDEFGRERL